MYGLSLLVLRIILKTLQDAFKITIGTLHTILYQHNNTSTFVLQLHHCAKIKLVHDDEAF